jgi:hypothetical protein
MKTTEAKPSRLPSHLIQITGLTQRGQIIQHETLAELPAPTLAALAEKLGQVFFDHPTLRSACEMVTVTCRRASGKDAARLKLITELVTRSIALADEIGDGSAKDMQPTEGHCPNCGLFGLLYHLHPVGYQCETCHERRLNP